MLYPKWRNFKATILDLERVVAIPIQDSHEA